MTILAGLPEGDASLFPGVMLPRLPPTKLLERVVATAIVGHDQKPTLPVWAKVQALLRQRLSAHGRSVPSVTLDPFRGESKVVLDFTQTAHSHRSIEVSAINCLYAGPFGPSKAAAIVRARERGTWTLRKADFDQRPSAVDRDTHSDVVVTLV